MREQQRDIKVPQTLLDISGQTAGIRHQLSYNLDLCTFQRHTPCHNQPNITTAEDNHLASGHEPLDIDEFLGSTGRVNTGRTGSGDIQCASSAFPASHRQYDCTRFYPNKAVCRTDGGNLLAAIFHLMQRQHHRRQQCRNAHFNYLFGISCGIFRTGQLFPKPMQTKTAVNTLEQDAAQLRFSFQNQDIVHCNAIFCRCNRRCKPGRPAADNHQFPFHLRADFTHPVHLLSSYRPAAGILRRIWSPAQSESPAPAQ